MIDTVGIGVTKPTIQQIETDRISELAEKYWNNNNKGPYAFNREIVDKIYANELLATRFSSRRLSMLEFSQYLERYLWPFFKDESASNAHVISLAAMVNEKFRERVDAWTTFQSDSKRFDGLFDRILHRIVDENEVLPAKTIMVTFLSHCVNSLEVDFVRSQVQRILGIECWHCIPETRREIELKRSAKLTKYWRYLQKCDAAASPEQLERKKFARTFVSTLLDLLFVQLDLPPSAESIDFCECVLDFLVDALSQLPTRRFLNTLLDTVGIIVRTRRSAVYSTSAVFRKNHKRFCEVVEAEIDDCTGDAVSFTGRHYQNMGKLQRSVFKLVRKKKAEKCEDALLLDRLTVFAASSIAAVDEKQHLERLLADLSDSDVEFVCQDLAISVDRCQPFLRELLLEKNMRKSIPLDVINSLPLFPTEHVIWDLDVVPEHFGSGRMALPKLNLQFLTLLDYLQRNISLFRLESTFQIRQDLESAISRLRPARSEIGQCIFCGWSRMALPIQSFTIVDVRSPKVGEQCPSAVKADIELLLDVRSDVRQEWEALRKHDVCFLLSIKGPPEKETDGTFPEVHGIQYVRGCEIEGMLDVEGKVIEEGNPNEKPVLPPGSKRTYRVWLDPNQYYEDSSIDDVYDSFNIIVRRKPKENNFKAVLETIRTLMNIKFVVPPWLNDLILGYGDPSSAHFSNLKGPDYPLQIQDWHDTFIDRQHLESSFPGYTFNIPEDAQSPFRLQINDRDKTVNVYSYKLPMRGPFTTVPVGNRIPFTPAQVAAIRSGMSEGLTMIVGPPGTGKTDVAVQIIANIYRSYPAQRTLVVAHSNQALNQLFEKIIHLNVDQRHLLRLGHGEQALDTELDFSRYGRVDYILQHRMDLLAMVERLAKCLEVQGDVSYTCETASYFFLHYVVSRWEEFLEKASNTDTPIADIFPFTKFFPAGLFDQPSRDEQLEFARSCFRDIQHIFRQLDEFRAFEQMRSGAERAKYLLVKEAKIVAMTCTHAALKRRDLVECGFKYDNILMEEAAQILEIETFIPLLLQNPDIGHLRLKRWIMIGDHHQLPPVVKNTVFQKYSNMEQSLFTRFIRLGVPAVELDSQGRSRRSIAALYQWRYNGLGNLPHIAELDRQANPGFMYDYQVIDCEDIRGVGESEPVPYFYQNLCEAEYAVGVYMYMRLIGYPAERITIITTYNGQKHLIREIVKRRCGNDPLIGWPRKITTVDKYQGQQNDYILLSLVRTRNVGHLRDVRRLIVAMSRARLGLYIFARVALFQNCVELSPVFRQLLQRPTKLCLLPGDVPFPSNHRLSTDPCTGPVFSPFNIKQLVCFVYELHQYTKLRTERVTEPEEETIEGYDPLNPGFEMAKRPRLEVTETIVSDTVNDILEKICDPRLECEAPEESEA